MYRVVVILELSPPEVQRLIRRLHRLRNNRLLDWLSPSVRQHFHRVTDSGVVFHCIRIDIRNDALANRHRLGTCRRQCVSTTSLGPNLIDFSLFEAETLVAGHHYGRIVVCIQCVRDKRVYYRVHSTYSLKLYKTLTKETAMYKIGCIRLLHPIRISRERTARYRHT